MSIFASAILGELTSRSISFVIERISRPSTAPTTETLNSLQRHLLRAQVIIEEADGRLITNQAMLQLLNQLREEVYRGHHRLDTYRCRTHKDQTANQRRTHKDQTANQHKAVSPSTSTPSSFNPAKRFRFRSGSSSSSGSSELDQINEALSSLDMAIRDISEFVVFLSGCPPLYQQPYSMYLLLDKCMFGRKMEMEQIMNFLLQGEACGAKYPDVLPIVGPGKVGKTTMIEHACNDHRVRNHFSKILCVSQDSIKDEKRIAALSDCDVIKHHNLAIQEERTLVIIELTGEMDESTWRDLYSDCKDHLASGSKIILASRSETVVRYGTTQALRVQFFTQEAYWYFFKIRTFGSVNTEDHPKLATTAMEIARELGGCFFSAHLYSGLLKANFNAHFWSMALAVIKEFKRMNLSFFGSQFVDPWQVVEPVFMKKNSSEYLVILDDYQTGSAQSPDQSAAPILTIEDVIFGRVIRPCGKFKVLAWRSHLPPHYSYMMNCEARRTQQRMVSRNKRVQEIDALH